jgi:esterase/lipase superfamily enzyme
MNKMNRQELLVTLRNAIIDGTLTQQDWETAQKQAKQLAEEKQKRKQQAAEQHRLAKIEEDKPQHAFPRLYRFKHVPQNFSDLINYLSTYNLEALETYANKLAHGYYVNEFRGTDSFEALLFLQQQIALRKPHANNEKIKAFNEAKTEFVEAKIASREATAQLKETEQAVTELKQKLEGDPAKSKDYIK